jgi:putative tryptophan/tyrosine transport system substrate-binding protein
MKRRDVITLLGGAIAAPSAFWPLAARAQQPAPTKRIGLMANLLLPPIEAFRKKLQQLGYAEGKNLVIEYRFADGQDDRYAAFASELAGLPVDLIVAWGTPAAFAAKRATSTIPIVLGAVGDVINTGIVSNLARPEANITGFASFNVELEEKRLELLSEVVPRLSRVGVLANISNPLNRVNIETVLRAAEKLSVTIEAFEVKSSREIESALRGLTQSRPDAAIIASDALLLSERRRIAETMATSRIPAVYPFREYVEVGGFIIYGANLSILFERAADYVNKILRGERPGNLPVQQATAFELIINRKAADALGLTIPAVALVRADEVIE